MASESWKLAPDCHAATSFDPRWANSWVLQGDFLRAQRAEPACTTSCSAVTAEEGEGSRCDWLGGIILHQKAGASASRSASILWDVKASAKVICCTRASAFQVKCDSPQDFRCFVEQISPLLIPFLLMKHIGVSLFKRPLRGDFPDTVIMSATKIKADSTEVNVLMFLFRGLLYHK